MDNLILYIPWTKYGSSFFLRVVSILDSKHIYTKSETSNKWHPKIATPIMSSSRDKVLMSLDGNPNHFISEISECLNHLLVKLISAEPQVIDELQKELLAVKKVGSIRDNLL